MVDRIWPSRDIHILIPEAYKYVTLHAKGLAKVIKDLEIYDIISAILDPKLFQNRKFLMK